MRNEIQAKITEQRRIAEEKAQEEVVLPNMTEIDSKFSAGIAILHSRVEREPYLNRGFLYSGNNGHHAVAFYKIPKESPTPDGTDPVFTVIGKDLTACLHDAAIGLTQTEKEHPTKWEVYTVDVKDLERIKKHMYHTVSTKPGITFSIHRTPLTNIIEQNTPKSESESQESESDLLRNAILKRYTNAPTKPQ